MPLDPARAWLTYAKDDLQLASLEEPGLNRAYLCFHCQQAAEKALKALLLERRIRFPHTHDLVRLMTILQESGCDLSSEIKEATELTEFAVAARYPGFDEPVTEDEWRRALTLAKRVVAWVDAEVARLG